MRKIIGLIDKVLDLICISSMGLIALIVIVSVFQRYVFGKGFLWGEELVSMLFVATTFFGTVMGVKRKEHITISFFLDQMPSSLQNTCRAIAAILSVLIQIVIILVSIKWIGTVGNVLTPISRLPIQYFYYMLPISAGLLIIYELRNVVDYTADAIKAYQSDRRGDGIGKGGL